MDRADSKQTQTSDVSRDEDPEEKHQTEDVEKGPPFCPVGEDADSCGRCGKQCGDTLTGCCAEGPPDAETPTLSLGG